MNWILLFSCLLNAPTPSATGATTQATTADRPTLILVVGAAGEDEFGQVFVKSADRWVEAARRGNANLVQVGRDDAAPAADDKNRLKALIDEQCAKPSSQPLWLVLIGHGTFDGKEAKFNLRGPDVADHELADWLKNGQRPLAVIDCSASSAPFLNRLAAQNRIVITATQSGHEVQYARFGDYLSAAITDPAADLDKDGQTSLLEAYLAASHGVEEFYKQEGRLATEHALLDDNGDGRGTPAAWFQGIRATRAAKDGAPLDGARAHQWHLVKSAAELAMTPQARAKRDDLELKIEALRGKKASIGEAEYYKQLDELMVQLARVYQGSQGARP
ncbi:MAG TPA: hypothetical protein VH475_20365 [Tepidisphaeraceae bacterium]|jgi:hypothetical protein